MRDWIYDGKPIENNDIPSNAIGFLYVIEQVSSGKKYIGKKLLTFAKTRQVKGKKVKTRVESDWRDYWSSSPLLLEMIQEYGKDDFKRIILCFAMSKSELLYLEEYSLFFSNSMLSDKWLNENIRSKIMKKWFYKNKIEFKKRITSMNIFLT